MGLFKRKTMEERQEKAMKTVDDIAQGKGLTGKMTKAFMGKEFTQAVQGANASIQSAQQTEALKAAGVPTTPATVISLQDTGQTINDNPTVLLVLEVEGQQVSLVTLVSRLEIPRVGEQVLVLRDPASGQYLYAGLAPRS